MNQGNSAPFKVGDVLECIRETDVSPGSNMGGKLKVGDRNTVGRMYQRGNGWVIWFSQWDDIGVRYPASAFKCIGRSASDPGIPLRTMMDLHNEESRIEEDCFRRRRSGGPQLQM